VPRKELKATIALTLRWMGTPPLATRN